ncbi:MAG: HEAT repeat protein [Planctomycetota bacterium]|jgi:HEAT repeat protein
MKNRLLPILILGLFTSVLAAQNQISWAKSLDSALAKAKAENKPLLICMNMDKDVANDRMAREHYHDPAIVAKTKEFVCVFVSRFKHTKDDTKTCGRCGHITCKEHIKADLAVRELYFENSISVVAPQHVFLRPDGKLLRTKLYFLTKPELLSLMDSVLRELFPERFKKPEEAKEEEVKEEAPKGEKKDEEKTGEDEEPKTVAELKDLIVKSSEVEEIKEFARELINRKKDQEAIDILEAFLTDKKSPVLRLQGLMLAYGFKDHKEGVPKIIRFLKHKDPSVRSHTAVALEDIGDESALKPLNSRMKREKEDAVRKNLVRAIGVCGKKKKKTQTPLLKLLRDKTRLVQRNAALALGNFEKGGKAEKALLQMAFQVGGGGRGGRGGFGRIQNNQAALYALVQMGSEKAKKKTEEQIEKGEGFMADAFQRVLDAFNTPFDPTNPEVVRWRRSAGGDKIKRDLDPENVPGGRGRGNGEGGDNRRDRRRRPENGGGDNK